MVSLSGYCPVTGQNDIHVHGSILLGFTTLDYNEPVGLQHHDLKLECQIQFYVHFWTLPLYMYRNHIERSFSCLYTVSYIFN